jgi:Fe-S-cluster containining protein
VRVSDAEIAALAQRLELADSEFRAIYTRRLRGGDVSLRERRDGDCVFWDERRGCSVHSDRPLQCRTFPFWESIVHSPERWRQEARDCPGMNQGPLWRAEWIRHLSRDDGTTSAAPRGPD